MPKYRYVKLVYPTIHLIYKKTVSGILQQYENGLHKQRLQNNESLK